MSNFLTPKTEKKKVGVRLIIYGPPKIGKSTFASCIPNHLFMNLDKGLNYIEGAVEPEDAPRNYDEVKSFLKDLSSQEHPYKTIVIDTIDKVEGMMGEWIVSRLNKPQLMSIADVEYKKGYELLVDETRKFITYLDYLAIEKGINVILLAHETTKKIQPPVGEEYTRKEPSLFSKKTDGESCLKLYQDWADAIGFAAFDVVVSKTGQGFNSRGQASGTGRRFLHLDADNPAYVAGNRFGISGRINFSWSDFVGALKEARNQSAAADSSKKQESSAETNKGNENE